MKVKTLVMAASALAATGAYAQSSVTLYGVADVGIEYINKASGGHSFVGLQSGNHSGTRWGLRGVEDLGNGMKSVFVLESSFNMDDGRMGQSGRLFGRSANVGLLSQWGQLTFGRHNSPFYDFGATFDPMGISSRFSVGAQDPFMGGQRADNSVKYMGKFGALSLTVMYSFNHNAQEAPGNFTNGREYSASASYSADGLSVGAIYDQTNKSAPTILTTNNLARWAALAGTYAFGPAKVYAGYRFAKAFDGDKLPGANVVNTASNLAWAGVVYQSTPQLLLSGAVYYQNLRDAYAGNPWEFIITADYTLSKRTDVYASFAYALNNSKSSLSVNGFAAAASEAVVHGSNQLGAVVGVRHKF